MLLSIYCGGSSLFQNRIFWNHSNNVDRPRHSRSTTHRPCQIILSMHTCICTLHDIYLLSGRFTRYRNIITRDGIIGGMGDGGLQKTCQRFRRVDLQLIEYSWDRVMRIGNPRNFHTPAPQWRRKPCSLTKIMSEAKYFLSKTMVGCRDSINPSNQSYSFNSW